MVANKCDYILLSDYCKGGLNQAVEQLLARHDDIDICYDEGTFFYFAFKNGDEGIMILNLLLDYAKKHNINYDKLTDALIDAEERSDFVSAEAQEIIKQFKESIISEELDDIEYSVSDAFYDNNIKYLQKHIKDFKEFIQENGKFKLAEKASINGHEEVIALMCELFSSKYTKAALYRRAAMVTKDFYVAEKYLLKACNFNTGYCAGYKSLGELCDKHGKALKAAKYFIQVDIHNKQKNAYDKMYDRLKTILETNSHDHSFIELAKAHISKGTIIYNATLKDQLISMSQYKCDTSIIGSESIKQQFIAQKSDDEISQTTLSTEALSKFTAEMRDNTSMSFTIHSDVCASELTLAEQNLLLAITEKYKHNFNTILEQFITILEKHDDIDVKEVLNLYAQDERHLEYLANDCYTVFLNNVPIADKSLCDFVIHNGYLKKEDIIDIRTSMSAEEQKTFDIKTNGEYSNSTDDNISNSIKSTLTANDLLEILNHTKDNNAYNTRVTQWIDDTTYRSIGNSLQNNDFFSENLHLPNLMRQDSLSGTVSSIEDTIPSESNTIISDSELSEYEQNTMRLKSLSIQDVYNKLEQNLNNNNQHKIAISYNNLGTTCMSYGQIDFAILCYEKSLSIQQKLSPNTQFHTVIYDNLGSANLAKGELNKAIEYYNKAFQIKNLIYQTQPININIARSYDDLAGVYTLMKCYQEALQYLKQSLIIKMALCQQQPTNTHIADSCVITLNHLGNIYNDLGNISEALEYYNEALEIRQKIYTQDKSRPDILLNSYLSLSYACKAMGKHKEATSYLTKAIKIKETIENIKFSDPYIMVSIYHNIGLANQSENHYDEAILCYTKELNVKKELYSKNLNHPSIAASYRILGNVYNQAGEVHKAMEFYLQELHIKEKIYINNQNHHELMLSYHSLGDVCSVLGLHGDAISYYQKALQISKIFPNHPQLQNIYNNLAISYSKTGQFDKALHHHEEALHIAQNIPEQNRNYIFIALIHNNLGNIFIAKGDSQNAIKHHKTSLEIKMQYPKIFKHSDIADTYITLGKAYLEQENISQADDCYNKALQEVYKAKENNDVLVRIYTSIGDMYAREDQELQKALKHYTKALDVATTIYKDLNHVNLAKCYNSLGTIYLKKREYTNSEVNYKNALKIIEKLSNDTPGDFNPNIALLYNNLGNLYQEMQKWDSSIYYLTKAYETAYHNVPFTEAIKKNLVKSVEGFALERDFNPKDVLCVLTECLNSNYDFLDHNIQLYMSSNLSHNSNISPSEIAQELLSTLRASDSDPGISSCRSSESLTKNASQLTGAITDHDMST